MECHGFFGEEGGPTLFSSSWETWSRHGSQAKCLRRTRMVYVVSKKLFRIRCLE